MTIKEYIRDTLSYLKKYWWINILSAVGISTLVLGLMSAIIEDIYFNDLPLKILLNSIILFILISMSELVNAIYDFSIEHEKKQLKRLAQAIKLFIVGSMFVAFRMVTEYGTANFDIEKYIINGLLFGFIFGIATQNNKRKTLWWMRERKKQNYDS